MNNQFELTVKILITVPDGDAQAQYDEAMVIAQHYAEMALKYKSIGADKIISVVAEPV